MTVRVHITVLAKRQKARGVSDYRSVRYHCDDHDHGHVSDDVYLCCRRRGAVHDHDRDCGDPCLLTVFSCSKRMISVYVVSCFCEICVGGRPR